MYSKIVHLAAGTVYWIMEFKLVKLLHHMKAINISAQYSLLFVDICVSCSTDTVIKTGVLLLMLMMTGFVGKMSILGWPLGSYLLFEFIITKYWTFTIKYDFINPSIYHTIWHPLWIVLDNFYELLFLSLRILVLTMRREEMHVNWLL